MTGPASTGTAVPGGAELVAEAQDLVAGLVAEPWGQVSASVYETGRLVTFAPWLRGHSERIQYLETGRRADGAWGGPDGYALVPTLSATEALLAEIRRAPQARPHLAPVAAGGLSALHRWLNGARTVLPDMPAIELIVPSLVNAVNRHLDDLVGRPVAGLDAWLGARLPMPAGLDDTLLAAISSRLRSGGDVPEKLLHALEVAGPAARAARAVAPVGPGTVGASPAATAAWLGERGAAPFAPARRYLEVAVTRHFGPAPCGLPITVFEQGWVLSVLARAGIPLVVPDTLLQSMRAAASPGGAPAGPGLPADADTTSVALYALALLGVPLEPESLWAFQTDGHFCTWQGEQGFSATVNAHVLDAFGQYAASRPGESRRYLAATARLAALLGEHQLADGSWLDRWHASPFYAAVCCCLALDRFGGEESRPVVRRAVQWVLDTQRPDGSWGLWAATAEETAYALQILLMTGAGRGEAVARAAARGLARLAELDQAKDPPMWHDKDLYLPASIARAAILAARAAAMGSADHLAVKPDISTK